MIVRSSKIGSGISAVVIGSASFLSTLNAQIDQSYSDFVVGQLAWQASNKVQDLLAWPVFIIVSFLSFLALSGLSRELEVKHGTEASERFTNQLLYWSLPFYAGAASSFFGGSIDTKTVKVSAFGIISLGAIGLFKRNSSTKQDPNTWSIVLLISLLISLIPIELAVLLSRSPIGLVGDLKLNAFVSCGEYFTFFGFVFGVIGCERFESLVTKYLSKLILLAQIGLPLFFLTLYPSRIMLPSGEIIHYETTIYLKLVIFAATAYGILDVIKHFRFFAIGADWKRCFSPFAVYGLVVALKVGNTIAPHISLDDYHFGEHLLGWWSYLKGFVPYVDYVPAHGLLENDLKSFLSYFLYDGTAASIGEAGRLEFAILGLIAFLSMYYFSGSLILAFSVILLLGGRLTWFFFIPFICLWLSHSLRTQPGKWLSVWIVSAPFVILSIPPQGLLLVGSFGPLAIKIAWDQIKAGDMESWRHLCLVALITILTVVSTPLLEMLLGAIRYVLENGPINQIAYGIPWAVSWGAGIKAGFFFEAIRMSWVVIPLVCLYLIHNSWRSLRDSSSLFYPALIFLFFSLSLIPYSMGRIDPSDISRPGLVSMFSWTILFPLLVWGSANITTRPFVILVTVFISAGLGFGVTSFSGLPSVAAQKITSPPLRDSIASGLPNIGRAYVEKGAWERIYRLNKLLNLRLASNETYLDLTSRNAHYFYLNRAPAMPITAPFNLASRAQQRRAVEILKASPPKLALLQAENIVHDGGGLALRNPYLYHFVMDFYVPRMEAGFIVGYLKSSVQSTSDEEITAEIDEINDRNWSHGIGRSASAIVLSDPVLVKMLKIGDQVRLKNGELRIVQKVWPEGRAIWLNGGQVSTADMSSGNSVNVIVSRQVYQEYNASLFQRSFAISDFKKIPISWGKSEKTLQSKMTSPVSLNGLSPFLFHLSSLGNSYKIEGQDPRLIFDVSALGVSGQNAGLLKFDFICNGKTSEPRIQIFWWGDERGYPFEESSIRFTAENGTLIVPLDASPWWVGLSKIKGLRLDLDNATACRDFFVRNISLYERS